MSKKAGILDNERVQTQLRDIQRQLERQDEADLKAVLATGPGRRLVYRIVDRLCGVMDTTLDLSTNTVVHHEGKRSVGVVLMHLVQKADPDAWNAAVADRLKDLAEYRETEREARKAAEAEGKNE